MSHETALGPVIEVQRDLRILGSNQDVVRVWWLMKYISPSGVRACSHPSGSGPRVLGAPVELLPLSTAAATAATLAAAAVFLGSSHVVDLVKWLKQTTGRTLERFVRRVTRKPSSASGPWPRDASVRFSTTQNLTPSSRNARRVRDRVIPI